MGSERAEEEQTRLDRLGQYGPRGHETQRLWERRREFRKAIAQIPDECVTAGNDIDGRGLLEAAHGAQPLFEVAMIPLNAIIQIP